MQTRTIEIEAITFSDDQIGSTKGRFAVVTWRISTPGTPQVFTVPLYIPISEKSPETEVVTLARAMLHTLTRSLAEQTKPWVAPFE